MDSYNINKKNPFKFTYVKKKIVKDLKEFKGRFIIIKVPVVNKVCFGRKVGYKINKVSLPKKIQQISATKIRSKLKNI